MPFEGYNAYRKRYPDTGITLADKRKTNVEAGFPDHVKTGKKISAHDEWVHKDDTGKF